VEYDWECKAGRIASLRTLRTIKFALLLLCIAPTLHGQRWHASLMSQPPRQGAQPLDDMAHMSWTRRDGAPSDISALAQTTDGYLWIGTRLGLFRFDGIQFSSYPFTSADPRLPSSDISALAADRNGGLWIGYRMGGITYLHGSEKIDYDKTNGLVSESTEQLVSRDDGSVWATADGRLMHLTGSKWENYSASHGLASDGLYSLFFDRDGNLWTAYKEHVFKLAKGGDKFEPVAMPNVAVNQFVQMPDGAIWISDAWTNVRPLGDDKGAKAVRIPGVPVVLIDNEQSIWLAHDSNGLTHIRHPGAAAPQVENYHAANGLTDEQTRTILKDRQGAIWVGTARGLDRFQRSPLVQFRGVHLDYYPALVADRKQGIWFNDMDKPLMRLREGKLTFVSEGHGSSSLFQDTEGAVWLLDPITHDLYRYPENGGPATRLPAPAIARDVETWCLGEDRQKALLGCFEGHGLWRYDSGKWERVVAPELPEESPLSLMRSAAGRVWLGYPHNQIVMQDSGGYHAYGPQQGLELNTVLAFYDADGLVFAGGSDGLAFYDDRGFHALHLRAPGLLRGVSGIVKDRWGDLWLNSGSGVVRLPVAEWKAAMKDPRYAMDFQLLNERDGLIGTPAQNKPTPSAVMDTDGLLWFATSGHLVSLDPSKVREERAAPNVLLQSVRVNGAVVRTDGAPIKVDARRLKTLEFDYIGLDLNSPDRVVYQYMLEGQDKDWQDAGGRRQTIYTNLAPASYRFRVRAASGTGQWSELQSPLHLTVTPAFYQTKWFYALCTLVLGSLLWLIYRLRVHYLTARVQERLEERAHERARIARDLHDTLLQGVQGLMLRFHFATEQLPRDEPAREMLRMALDRADGVISEGREKVRELRVESTSPRELAKDLLQAASAMRAESEAKITLVVEGEARSLQVMVEEELYSIAREALANAVRHSGASQIELELAYDAKHLQLRCRDNGCGVSAEIMQAGSRVGHWGIIGMRERAVRLGCKLEFWSTPGSGTEVVVRIAAAKAYADQRKHLTIAFMETLFPNPR
jgi:signal transduction histidine kinase/ligand-binding sensor domain-containing protein